MSGGDYRAPALVGVSLPGSEDSTPMTTNTFKPVKDRRKSAPVKRVTLSSDTRKAYEDAIRQRDERERDHTRFLPDDRKGKR